MTQPTFLIVLASPVLQYRWPLSHGGQFGVCGSRPAPRQQHLYGNEVGVCKCSLAARCCSHTFFYTQVELHSTYFSNLLFTSRVLEIHASADRSVAFKQLFYFFKSSAYIW